MNYGFELMSEIIPLCIAAVLGIDINHRNPSTDCNTFLYVHKNSTIK